MTDKKVYVFYGVRLGKSKKQPKLKIKTVFAPRLGNIVISHMINSVNYFYEVNHIVGETETSEDRVIQVKEEECPYYPNCASDDIITVDKKKLKALLDSTSSSTDASQS